MIKSFTIENIIKTLGALFTYGLNNKYSYKAIEEYVTSSSFINELENNNFNNDLSINNLIEDTYKVKLNKDYDISFKGLFFAESYIKLFFSINRSFEYIFLYWPLSNFVNKYNIYHEMDFSNLKEDFIKEVNKTSLIKKLCLNKNIKYPTIAKLTGLNVNTIVSYARDDKNLDNASYKNIYKLIILFNVKPNLFISNLNIVIDHSVNIASNTFKKYRSYLGLYYANYFDKRIKVEDYTYDEINNCFVSKIDNTKLIVIAKDYDKVSFEEIKNIDNNKTYFVIFPVGYNYNVYSDNTNLDKLKAIDIMLILEDCVYIVKKKILKQISPIINRNISIRAKEEQ